MRHVLKSAVALLVACTPAVLQATSASPNFVLIIVDDQAWNGTSLQMDPDVPDSRSDYHQTPTLEALAREGVRFSSAYVTPVCKPTVMSMMTGKSSARLQRSGNSNSRGFDFPLMPTVYSKFPINDPLIAKEISITHRLKEVQPDYQTGHFGKFAAVLDQWGHFEKSGASGVDPPTVDPKDMFRFTRGANRIIEDSVAANKPFFVTITHDGVKKPTEALPETIAKYEAMSRGERHINPPYAAMTEDLDTSVGMILENLEALGVDDNTYIIYTADNGRSGEASMPLRGGKGALHEGGIRVPLVINGPGITAGAISDVPVTAADLYPTITELGGNPYPMRAEIDGASLVPVLTNGGMLPDGTASLVRPFGENGELFFHHTRENRPQSAVIDGDYKLIRYYGNPGEQNTFELFDLENDLSETTDLSGDMSEKVATLNAKLDRWLQGIDASQPYDVDVPMRLTWNASHLGPSNDVELSLMRASLGTDRAISDLNTDGTVDELDLQIKLGEFPKTWRSSDDVDYTARETWTLRENKFKPAHVEVHPHQPHLPEHAFRFDGNDGMDRMYFHVTNPEHPDVFDNAATVEFWLRFGAMDQPHILFETGGLREGMSVTFGDGDEDGDFDEVRFRARDDDGDSIVVTTEFDLFGDPLRDFFQVVATLNDNPMDRSAAIFINGTLFAHVDGEAGEDAHINWDIGGGAALGARGDGALGGMGGRMDVPFTGGKFNGDLSVFRFYNYALGADDVLDSYNAMLDDVGVGIRTVRGDARVPGERPGDVSEGKVESDETLLVMQERHDVLAQDFMVDVLAVGGEIYGAGGRTDGLEGLLPEGTALTSYLLHFDPESDANDLLEVSGAVVFDQTILGIIVANETLHASDKLLGSIGRYASEPRAFELVDVGTLTLSPDLRTLKFSLFAAVGEVAQLRVITQSAAVPIVVPLPSAAGAVLLLMSMGLVRRVVLWSWRKR